VNPRHLARTAVVLALGLVAVACSGGPGSSTTTSNQPSRLTVWLMTGSAPQAVVDGVNADFKTKHPNVTVDVQLQQWSDITTKLDTAFAGSAPPDVVELGNTLVAKYGAAGALGNLTSKKGDFENSSTWLQSLTDSCTVGGKLFCVPYYAGSRAVVYRKDMFDKAGVKPPTSWDEWTQASQKLMDANKADADFSALYYPGKYWYAALPFVWDMGGDIATQSGGQWKGSLDSPQSQQGLTTLSKMVASFSRADKTGDEAKQDQAFVQGHIAQLIANGWEIGVITDAKTGDPSLKDKLGVFPIPSHNAGQTAPVFLGGSDLGIAAKSKAQDLAQEWIGMLTGKKWQTQMATVGQVIPNSTTLLDLNKDNPLIGTFAAAAKNSRFVPNSPNWANVESANAIPDMLVSIFTGKASVADATKTASSQIGQILNGKS
jgi:N,N'-diacetylchitobiose transport system substrate-binding protein